MSIVMAEIAGLGIARLDIDGSNCGDGHYRTGHWLTLEYLAPRFCTEQRTEEDRVSLTLHQ